MSDCPMQNTGSRQHSYSRKIGIWPLNPLIEGNAFRPYASLRAIAINSSA